MSDWARPLGGSRHHTSQKHSSQRQKHASQRSQRARKKAAPRTTLTLSHEDLLRGTWPGILLEAFGRRLRETSGGIGCIDDADDEYDNSFKVDELDIFLSHSWHAPWMVKYLALLLHFNLKPALLVALAVALASFFHQRQETEDETPPPSEFLKNHVPIEIPVCEYNQQAFCYTLLLSSFGFVLVLLVWHNFTMKFGLDRSIFLDKVCIHQTNPLLKEAGIKSIGAILGKSKMVLVAWDPSYFTRLWCTYELSAYQCSRPTGRFMVLPVELGVFTCAATFISVACVGARYFVHHNVPVEIVSACAFVPLLLLMSRIRNYLASLEALQKQLESFSVKKSRCFCCDNNHVHPETAMPMSCDRDLVYESIAHWHGKAEDGENRLEFGLQRFDALVRLNLKRDMQRTLGKWAQVPYPHALMISMPPFLQTLDWHVHCPVTHAAWACFAQWLLRYPLCIAVILFTVALFRTKHKSRVTETVIEVALAFLSAGIIGGMTFLGDLILYSEAPVYRVVALCVEVLGVVILYFRRDSVTVDRMKWAMGAIRQPSDEFSFSLSDFVPTETFMGFQSRIAGMWQQARSGGARGSPVSAVDTVELADFQNGTGLLASCPSCSDDSKIEAAGPAARYSGEPDPPQCNHKW